MIFRRLARSIGWALAYLVGDGILLLGSLALLLAWSGRSEPPVGLPAITLGIFLLFAAVAVLHEFSGKLARTNHALRTAAMFVLWPLAFYFASLALIMLTVSLFPVLGRVFGAFVFAPAVAGGVAGSLCWRGKLPGTRSTELTRPSQAPSEPSGPRDEEEKD